MYAAGDVTGGRQFVYVAAAQGRVAARNATTDGGERVDYTGLPAVIFTRPQLVSAGEAEQQALAAGYTCDCRVLAAADISRAVVNGDTLGAVKLVADAATGRLLGVPRRARRRRRADACRDLRSQGRHDRRRCRRHLGAMPDGGRVAAPRCRAVRGHLPTSCCA